MSDVPRSLQSWVSTIQSVAITADVFRLFMKYPDWWELRKKTWKSEKCVWDLRPERLWTRESWRMLAKIKICQIWRNIAATGLCIPHLEQHRCSNRTVHRLLRSEDSSAATPLLRDCVRVNSFGTGSQHIPDLEQQPNQMRVNSFARLDNPDLKQHRCYGTVYVLNRLCIMYYYEFGLFCVAFIL